MGILAVALLAAGCRGDPLTQDGTPPPPPTSIATVPGAAPSQWTTPVEAPAPPPAEAAPVIARLGRHSPFELGPIEREDAISKALARAGVDPAAAERAGEPGGVDLAELETAGPWKVSLTAGSTFLWGGEFDNGDEGLDTWIHRLRLSFEKPMDYFGKLGLNASYTLYDFDFTGPNALFPGVSNPFERVHAISVGANVFQPVHEKVALVLTANAGAAAEVGVALEDAFVWSVTFGGGYRITDEFDFGGGVFVAGRFEEDLLFFGGPQFAWRPTERWRIALDGANLSATFKPNATWSWGVAGGFESLRFRMLPDAPGLSQIVTDSRLPIYLKVRYRGSATTELELRVGANVYRDFVLEDAQGENGVGLGSDPAPFFALRLIHEL